MSQLPPVAPQLLVAAMDALPSRLRRRVDDAVSRAAGWPVTTGDDGTVTVTVDEATTVTLTVTGGAVRHDGDARCSCLLAPNCLHRAAVLARAPIGEVATEPAPGAVPATQTQPPTETETETATDTAPAATGGTALTPGQRDAAGQLWRGAVELLGAGVTGSGLAHGTTLLRAAHGARAAGLHRGAATATRVAALLQAAHGGDDHYRLADLTNDLRELLALGHRLRTLADGAVAPDALLGTARRRYREQGSLRLFGLCVEPVVTDSGYAGAVTYLVDRDGRVWSVADLYPGGVDRAAGAGDSAVALGEASLSHRALARAGLVVSGATATESGQLGAGASVRAVRADGAAWSAEPLAALWREPLDAQLRRAFAALAVPWAERRAGAELLFLTVRLLGAGAAGSRAVTADGVELTLTEASGHDELAYLHNLRMLDAAAGARVLLVGRVDPERRATVRPLAVAPVAPDAGWTLPDGWGGHVDLGYDRLHRSHLGPAGAAAVPEPQAVALGGSASAPDPAPAPAPETGDPQLRLLRRHLERVVAGGRAVHALAAVDGRRLRAARLETGAALLAALTGAARQRERDVFGRLAGDDGAGFALRWLAAATYEEAASRELAQASWLPPAYGVDQPHTYAR